MDGHTVIMACRNHEKSQPVRDQIAAETGNERVFLEEVDMSSFESIRNFCSNYREKYKELDDLIHNAAYFNHGAPYKQSKDGIEITFATNVAGPFLMTMLLRDLLAQSLDAWILHAGSNIIKHFLNPKKEIGFDHLQNEPENPSDHSVYINYRNSKMALLMLTFRMAEEFKRDGIKVYSIQINGATMSKDALMKVKSHWRMIARIQNLFFRPPEFTSITNWRL
jgi:NAD(P)-dependent dehydrogenase (short-subunit alcohol dehydrogenase family)